MKIQKYIWHLFPLSTLWRGVGVRVIAFLFITTNTFAQSSDYDIISVNGNYSFSYNQVPENLVPLNSSLTGFTFQWQQSVTPLSGFINISGATQASYSFSAPLSQTTYFMRKATDQYNNSVYSNILKIEVVSVNWENINYVREHDVLITAQTDWKVIDQLPIGQKLQTTTYMDGLGRPLQKVSRETATPSNPNNLWGDVVQFSQYDIYGRQPQQYLPYTTTTESGKYKTTPLTEQPNYYSTTLNETFAYSTSSFDNSPLNRVVNVKSPGTSWNVANALGNSAAYELNDAADNVQKFTIGYTTGDAPVNAGAYPANTLYKIKHTDENGKQVIEYTDKSGQLILTKTQDVDNPSTAHIGWICVYSIYDDFGLLRYRFQPEAVKYLDANAWSFAGTNGQQVLNELCFRYEYDDKGRNILKKAPGAKELRMLYDQRDRVVFMQDGNQSVKSTPQWTANLYDELDRVIITTLYNTTKSVTDLQTDINNSVTINIVTVVNPNQNVTNLIISNRDASIPRYAAQNSIEFTPGFESITNDAFVAEIDATASQSYTVTTATYNNPISSADLNNASVCTVLKYLFYDSYSFSSVKSFDNNFDNTTAYSNSDANVIPITASSRTISFPTGSSVRVLGTNTFLNSTEFYDEKGRHIQTLEDNFKSGTDVTTMQYHWDGRLLSTHSKHTTANTGYSSFSILTKNIFDKIGRVISLQKKYGNNDFKTIASYDLDDMGRLKTKHLDPGYTGSGKNEMESLAYTYNIHNNITGINKDYALKANGYDKWGNFFGLYLGYDNRDNVFNIGKLDGHVTGLLWNTMGDDAQRKYDYTYDNAGRLIKSDFKEKQTTGAAWDNTKMDFTVGGGGSNNTIQYDLNGNLQTMFQKGIVIGNNTPLNVDNLQYIYSSYSNKLTKGTDNGNAGAANGKLGDFADGTNGSADDYVYDDNGNLVVDLNKNIQQQGGAGITYNFLDKPEQITIAGKGTIQIVYDADGNKLQKKYTPINTSTTTTTTYINEFVYTGDALSYINFEEGRIRVITPVSQSNAYDGLAIDGNMLLPNEKKGTYDFFIRDYQQNVRMILTEEIHNGYNTCSMESTRAGDEEPIFGQQGTNNEVSQTRTDKPSGWQSNTSASVSKLGNLTHKAGPNVLLKVMAGDQISATTQYYYQNNVTNGTGNNLTNDVLNQMLQSILGSSSTGLAKGNTTSISNNLLIDPNFVSATNPQANNPNGTNPKAYMTIMFFDERFNFVSEGSTALRVSQQGDNAAPLVLANIKSPKNGYAYVYLSNESNEPVYFDNFKVGDNRGRIIEEDHYYSFGLKIAAISSKKLPDANEGNIDNKNLYNDKELFDDADLDWYDYGFRNYDPQIGRFTQLDPLTDDYPELTPYQYAGDEPIANIDIDGLEPCPVNVAGDAVKAGASNLFTNTVLTVTNTLAKAGSRTIQDNTYVKTPLLIFQQRDNENLDKKHATMGPARQELRSKEDQAVLDMISKNAEKNTERKRRERFGGYDIPIMGDLFKTINRAGHGDFSGATESGVKFGIVFISIPAGGEGAVVTDVLSVSEINFMQSSIKNVTGEFTVLGNAQALKSGTLNPEILQMNVWKDAAGKVWTLDNRRLASFKLSGLKNAPVRWTNPTGEMWKMSTKNGGASTWLKFGGGNGLTVK
jgi:RHS repeat-associated protein